MLNCFPFIIIFRAVVVCSTLTSARPGTEWNRRPAAADRHKPGRKITTFHFNQHEHARIQLVFLVWHLPGTQAHKSISRWHIASSIRPSVRPSVGRTWLVAVQLCSMGLVLYLSGNGRRRRYHMACRTCWESCLVHRTIGICCARPGWENPWAVAYNNNNGVVDVEGIEDAISCLSRLDDDDVGIYVC